MHAIGIIHTAMYTHTHTHARIPCVCMEVLVEPDAAQIVVSVAVR